MKDNLLKDLPISWAGQTEIWNHCQHTDAGLLPIAGFQRYQEWAKANALKVFATFKVAGLEVDDYIHFAYLGLLESLKTYQPQLGVPFKSYAKKRVKGSVINNVAKYLSSRGDATDDRLESLLAPTTTANDSQIERFIQLVAGLTLGVMLEPDTHQHTVESSVEDASENLVAIDRIKKSASRLPDNLKTVIELHYFANKSFAEIAKTMHVSRGRVSQLHKEGLMQLQRDAI